MSRWLCGLAAAVLACQPAAAHAQQGTVQVSAAVQGITGAPERLAGQRQLEPDFGVSWLQPGSRLGTVQLEVRGTRRDSRVHLGRTNVALRDLRYAGLSWTMEGGDTYFTRAIGDYRFTNLTTPAVTFSGAAVTGRSTRGTLHVVGGRATAWRNIFGTDPQTLGQSLLIAGGAYRPSDRLEVTGRASRIRTSGLKTFNVTIADSHQAGAGVRMMPAPPIQLIADGSVVRFRRIGAASDEIDGSLLAGANIFLARGWIQLNASRFSPGDFPVINDPLRDRESVFAVGEYDVWRRVRVFAGWNWFGTGIGPQDQPRPGERPENMGVRTFGGVRVPVGPRSTITLRGEEGDAKSRSISNGLAFETNTGVWSAEWQGAFGALTTYTRASRRENVSRTTLIGSYTQHDVSSQLFLRLSGSTQLFGLGTVTRHETGEAAGSAYWQAGGGGQVQVARGLWARAELTASRSVDLTTRDLLPRNAVNVSISGQVARGTSISLNLSTDRTPLQVATATPWTTRATLRVVRTFATGSARVAGTRPALATARPRGTGTVGGGVFADWNANGAQDPDEEPLDGIPVQLGALGTVATSRTGEFTFLSVPAGRQHVGLDTSAIPVDYDLPAITAVDLELDTGTTRRVSFGLIPLGSVRGQVFVDANGNGVRDPGEAPLDGAVLVLDGGERSEQVRRGAYRFDAVRSGAHVLTLLTESLPEGAVVPGGTEVTLALTRAERSADVDFPVLIHKRPENRRVFPPGP